MDVTSILYDNVRDVSSQAYYDYWVCRNKPISIITAHFKRELGVFIAHLSHDDLVKLLVEFMLNGSFTGVTALMCSIRKPIHIDHIISMPGAIKRLANINSNMLVHTYTISVISGDSNLIELQEMLVSLSKRPASPQMSEVGDITRREHEIHGEIIRQFS